MMNEDNDIISNYSGCGELYDDGEYQDIKNTKRCGDNGYCDNCSESKSKANSEDQE